MFHCFCVYIQHITYKLYTPSLNFPENPIYKTRKLCVGIQTFLKDQDKWIQSISFLKNVRGINLHKSNIFDIQDGYGWILFCILVRRNLYGFVYVDFVVIYKLNKHIFVKMRCIQARLVNPFKFIFYFLSSLSFSANCGFIVKYKEFGVRFTVYYIIFCIILINFTDIASWFDEAKAKILCICSVSICLHFFFGLFR